MRNKNIFNILNNLSPDTYSRTVYRPEDKFELKVVEEGIRVKIIDVEDFTVQIDSEGILIKPKDGTPTQEEWRLDKGVGSIHSGPLPVGIVGGSTPYATPFTPNPIDLHGQDITHSKDNTEEKTSDIIKYLLAEIADLEDKLEEGEHVKNIIISNTDKNQEYVKDALEDILYNMGAKTIE